MDINSPTKFLCRKDEDDLMPINSKFSGIFNKSLFAEKLSGNFDNKVNDKELSLSDYFKSLQL